MSYYTYILFNQRNGTLYIGVTNHLVKRVYEHKQHIFKGFTDKYDIDKLAYYEIHDDINEAIKREKQLKAWKKILETGINRKPQSGLERLIWMKYS